MFCGFCVSGFGVGTPAESGCICRECLHLCKVQSSPDLDEKSQSVLLECEEAEEMVLATFGEGNQVPETVCIDRFAFQYLRNTTAY